MTKDHKAGDLEQQKWISQLWSYKSEIQVLAGTRPFVAFRGESFRPLPASVWWRWWFSHFSHI